MSVSKVGIDVLEQDIVIVCNAMNIVDKSLADNHISPGEWWKIGQSGIDFIKVIRTWKEAGIQAADIDEQEKLQLQQRVVTALDLRNDKAEQIVENVVNSLISLAAVMDAQRAA